MSPRLIAEDGGNDVARFYQAGEAERGGPSTRRGDPERGGGRARRPGGHPAHGTDVAGIGVVSSGDARSEVQVRSPQQVIDLIDDFELALSTGETNTSTRG